MRFRGGWLHTGPSPRQREGGGVFFKVGGMRGRPGVQSGSRRLVACQHHDVPLVPRDRWIYTHSLSSPSTLPLSSPLIGIQFVTSPALIVGNRHSSGLPFGGESRKSNHESHRTANSNLLETNAPVFLQIYVDVRARNTFWGCNSVSGKCSDRSVKMWIALLRSRTKSD